MRPADAGRGAPPRQGAEQPRRLRVTRRRGGWADIEIGNRYINDALNHTTGDIRRIAEVMVGQAEAALHQWLNVTLLAGAALVGLGVLVAIVGGLRT